MLRRVATESPPRDLCYFPAPMALASTDQILQSTHQWLKPLIHVLLSCGITWREFAELSRTTYVEVATENFGKRGRPTNVSRTAILTGLSRRDVRKQRQNLGAAPNSLPGYVTKASLVLSVWHLDPDFRDGKGRPAILRMSGKGKTFEAGVFTESITPSPVSRTRWPNICISVRSRGGCRFLSPKGQAGWVCATGWRRRLPNAGAPVRTRPLRIKPWIW